MALLHQCDRCNQPTVIVRGIQDYNGMRWELCPKCEAAHDDWLKAEWPSHAP